MEEVANIEWDNHQWDLSHYLMVLNDGSKEFKFDEACYAMLWQGWIGMERLFLLFPEHEQEGVEEYINWVLNSELFGEAFLTKDYQTGLGEGFEINIHQPTNFLFSSMAALRMPWEQHYIGYCSDFPFDQFRKMGFSEKQSLYLCIQSCIEKGDLIPNSYNDNHIPIPRDLGFDKYHPKNFNRQEGTMYDRAQSTGVSRQWTGRGESYCSLTDLLEEGGFSRNNYGEFDSVKITEELVSFLKEQLKEEEHELCVA